MANTRNQNLFNTVRGTLGQLTGKGGPKSRGRDSRSGGGLASQATDFIGGFLSGGDGKTSGRRSASRGRGRARSAGRRRR